MSLILVGDIGGTNMRYRLIHSTGTSDILLKSQEFCSTSYRSRIIETIKIFLSGESIPDIAVLGITGIVKQNELIVSYHKGSGFNASMITEHIGIPEVHILNDLVASGYGIFSLENSEYVEMNSGTTDPAGPKVCIALGTGMGQCYCIHNGKNYQVQPCEGGFQDFSPKTEEEKEFYEFTQKKFKTISLTYGGLISGNSAGVIYLYLRHANPEKIDLNFERELFHNGRIQTKVMMKAGLGQENELCHRAVKIWKRIVGNLMGNLFVNFIPTGGIYLFGGVIAKNFEGIIEGNEIREGYFCGRAKELHESMSSIPIFIVRAEDLGLRGSLIFAKNNLLKYL